MKFPFYKQLEAKDCGATCLRMIASFYGKDVDQEYIRKISETSRTGTSLFFIARAAERLGFRTFPVSMSHEQLKKVPLPAILHWDQNHFIVLYKIRRDVNSTTYFVSDPELGKKEYKECVFKEHWCSKVNSLEKGIALLLKRSTHFKKSEEQHTNSKLSIKDLFLQFTGERKFVFSLFIGLLLSSIIQIAFPFLTQAIVDIGIRNEDIGFIYIIVLAQLFLFLGKISIDAVRNWILLHIGSRLNLSINSSFFIKLMKLPISYFDSKLTGDLLKRLNDHTRIQHLYTNSTLNILFSIISTIVLSLVLAYYDLRIFAVFLVGSLLYVIWIFLFLNRRRNIDQERFKVESTDKSKVLEILNGMQEIKLNNIEQAQRWSWEKLQLKIFKIDLQTLRLSQLQDVGSGIINECKNILIIIMAAILVVQNKLTLGAMLAIVYIVGQLNSPLLLVTTFVRDWQDAKISLERISEIYNHKDEDELEVNQSLTIQGSIKLKQLSFRYSGSMKQTLSNLDLIIPENKITAIVGHSGSGKTTLLKVLLKFYENYEGKLTLDRMPLNRISHKEWRNHCGTVLQDSFIFNDTIAYNVSLTAIDVDFKKLSQALYVANALEFIDDLVLGVNTKIGSEYHNLSKGQQQRILIARAVYKNPPFLFFDEATSSLDADNEVLISERLKTFYENKTVVIVAHRLSTIINADQIILLNQGKIIEQGTHQELIAEEANYFNLIKNQLQIAV